MEDAFDSYIKKLNELEQAENRAALYSFCSLNEPVLSYFKSIWAPLQSILQSSQVDTEIIDEVKPMLVILSEIRDIYESLKSRPAKSCQDEIIHFQTRIDSLTVCTCDATYKALLTLESKNKNALLPPKVEEEGPVESKPLSSKQREERISFKYSGNVIDNTGIIIYFDGERLGPPPCSIVLPKIELKGKKHVIYIDYLPKKKRVLWEFEKGAVSKEYYVSLRTGLGAVMCPDPVKLSVMLWGKMESLVHDGFINL